MPTSDSAARILFVGPYGAGKKNAIRAISDHPPVSDSALSMLLSSDSLPTTVTALDYGIVNMESGETLQLYGLHGPRRLDSLMPFADRDVAGWILLLDAKASHFVDDFLYWLDLIARISYSSTFVIGISNTDDTPSFSMETPRCLANSLNLAVPIFAVDPREPEHVMRLVRALLLMTKIPFGT